MKNTQQLEDAQQDTLETTEATQMILNDLGTSTLFRCDACGAQAFAAAVKSDLMLLFCGHHHRRYGNTLEAQGWDVHDHTHKINEKPSVSANA